MPDPYRPEPEPEARESWGQLRRVSQVLMFVLFGFFGIAMLIKNCTSK